MLLHLTSATLAAALLLGVAACADAPTEPDAPTLFISIEAPRTALEVGQQVQLAVRVTDAAGAPVPAATVAFTCDLCNVASVGASGVVTGVSPGTAVITATAGAAHATVRVNVQPAGALTVATLALQGGSDEGPLLIDTWSLARPTISFIALNAAGQSLCETVRLDIEVDTLVVAAEQGREPGAPCSMLLHPRRPGTTLLRVSAGGVADSVELAVQRTTWRVAFGSDAGDATAGGTVRYEVHVVGDDGRPAAGLPVTIAGGYDVFGPSQGQSVKLVIDSAGFARADLSVPTSTLRTVGTQHMCGLWPYPSGCTTTTTRSGPPFRTFMRMVLPDSSVVEQPETKEVVPGAPERIVVYVEECSDSSVRQFLSTYSGSCEVRPAGDSAVVGTFSVYESQPVEGWSSTYSNTIRFLAVAVDRYGNSGRTAPTLSGPAGTFLSLQRWQPATSQWGGWSERGAVAATNGAPSRTIQ